MSWATTYPIKIFSLFRLGFLLGFLQFATSAVAQGCASCYTTTAAGGPQTVHALRSGILMLFLPPVVIFGGILITVKRWKRQGSWGEK